MKFSVSKNSFTSIFAQKIYFLQLLSLVVVVLKMAVTCVGRYGNYDVQVRLVEEHHSANPCARKVVRPSTPFILDLVPRIADEEAAVVRQPAAPCCPALS